MTLLKRNLILHLNIGISLYVLCASFDVYFTLRGTNGDISLEGNPIMRSMMMSFGPFDGLVVEKSLVLLVVLMVAILAANGIEKEANWVYYLALTDLTRNWMKRKKRYWVAFVPLYFVALSQGVAAASWAHLIAYNGNFWAYTIATVILGADELESLRQAHREYCAEIMAECQEDYPDDKELQLAMFNHRCDKVFSWITQALDEKVRSKGQ